MDTHTGIIYEELDEKKAAMLEEFLGHSLVPLSDDEAEHLRPMSLGKRKNYMRNKPCPCGSGAKFKRCCWSKY